MWKTRRAVAELAAILLMASRQPLPQICLQEILVFGFQSTRTLSPNSKWELKRSNR